MPGSAKVWGPGAGPDWTAAPAGSSVGTAAPAAGAAASTPSTDVATAAIAASDRVRRTRWHQGIGLSGRSVPAADRSGAYVLLRFRGAVLNDPFGDFTRSAGAEVMAEVIKDTGGSAGSRATDLTSDR